MIRYNVYRERSLKSFNMFWPENRFQIFSFPSGITKLKNRKKKARDILQNLNGLWKFSHCFFVDWYWQLGKNGFLVAASDKLPEANSKYKEKKPISNMSCLNISKGNFRFCAFVLCWLSHSHPEHLIPISMQIVCQL